MQQLTTDSVYSVPLTNFTQWMHGMS